MEPINRLPQSTSSCQWKPIKNFENEYLISSDGRVFSIKSGKCLSLSPPNYVVQLYGSKGKEEWMVARLVATHFLPGQFENAIVWHKDRDKSNNSVDNLVWMSRSESCKLKQTLEDWRELTANKHGVIYCYGPNNIIETARSIREATEKTGISKSTIQYALKNNTQPHGWTFERVK